MRRRHLYVLLFSVPSLCSALLAGLAAFGAAAGMLWLFVYGDNAWPPAAQPILVAVFIIVAAATGGVLVWAAYAAGRRAEASESLNRAHVLGAALATVALPLLLVLYQWRVGNIGAPSEGEACMDYCRGKGFSASATPPRDSGKRTCSCLDAQGREAATFRMEEIR